MPRIQRIRYLAGKKLIVVHSRSDSSSKAEVNAVGKGPWVSVRVKGVQTRSRLPLVQKGKKIIQKTNKQRRKKGQRPVLPVEWSSMRKAGVRRQIIQKGSRLGEVFLEVQPRRYGELMQGRAALEEMPQERRKAMLLRQRRSGKGLYNQAPHLLGAGSILLIGNKWIMIPRLSKKNYANPSRFYFFAGLMEQPVKQFRGNIPVLPTARRELTEETGIPQNQIEIVGPGLKKTSSKKARALVSVHSAESKSPGQDLIWLGRAKTKDPKGFLKRFFVQRSDGEWVPKKAKDQWEIGGGQLVEQSSQALHEFLETHKHEIASVALVALKALEMELKKNGR